ncbi:GNAT family N-acetyltransferase [Tersicoccus sp. MR15.9]|uniref:GNAT family N-acetyltransferase n=1 Tax=Tersicoccus mangrovi TaxID=3121635 RepID=UPI002FE5A97D
MAGTITLTAQTAPLEREPAVVTRPATDGDIPVLGQLYYSSYADSRPWTQEEATADVRKVYADEFGRFLPEASLVVPDEQDNPLAALLVVDGFPDSGLPEAPFVLELFTHPDHRRKGYAEELVRQALARLAEAGYEQVALRISENNAAALALYLTLDFQRWDPPTDDDIDY